MKKKIQFILKLIIICITLIILVFIFKIDKPYEQPNKLKHFKIPKIESVMGSIEIKSINLKSNIVYGDEQNFIDKYDICVSNKLNLFGQNSVILLGGHNTKKLKKLINISINDTINIKTNYGSFKYIVTDISITKVNSAKNKLIDIKSKKDVLELSSDVELLQIYTCYGSNNPNTPYRLLVKAKKII